MVDLSQSHHVYIATDGTLFKIGRTKNVRKRCTRGMKPIQSWWCPGRGDEIELEIKRLLRPYLAFCYSCEWFAISYESMLAAVEGVLHRNYFDDTFPEVSYWNPPPTKDIARLCGVSVSTINNRMPGGRAKYLTPRQR